MAQKQITFEGTEIEKDCRERNGLFMRLNPRTKREMEDEINPRYRKAVRQLSERPDNESTLNEFGVRQ
jgi:hypothetical protein